MLAGGWNGDSIQGRGAWDALVMDRGPVMGGERAEAGPDGLLLELAGGGAGQGGSEADPLRIARRARASSRSWSPWTVRPK